MTLTKGTRFSPDDVLARAAAWLRPLGRKGVERLLDVSKPTALAAMQGSLPRTDTFLLVLAEGGPKAAREILGPLIGPLDADTPLLFQCIDNLERLIGDYRHARSTRAAAAAAGSRLVPGRPVGDEVRARLGGGLDRRAAGLMGRPADRGERAGCGEVGPDDGALSIVAARRSLDDVGNAGPLLEHLSLWRETAGCLSLADAVAIARTDPLQTTGVAVLDDEWTLAHVAGRNVMHRNPAAMAGRPVAATDDPAYGRRLVAEFDAAANDDLPHLFDHGVSLLRDGRVSTACGRLMRAVFRDGNRRLLMSRFVRLDGAAA